MRGEGRRDPTVGRDEYIAELERRIDMQREQLIRMRRRSRVLLNLLERWSPRPMPGGGRGPGRVVCLFEDDVDS